MTDFAPQLTRGETDAARRVMDAVNLHYQARLASAAQGAPPQFVAIRLRDGRGDNVLYDSRQDAVNAKCNHPDEYFYVKVGVDMMPFREAVIVLMHHRQAYAAGVRFGAEAPVTPQLTELLHHSIPRTLAALDGARERYNRR